MSAVEFRQNDPVRRLRRGRPVKFYEFNGEQLSIYEIAQRTGLRVVTLLGRLKLGWSIERATSEPVQGRSARYQPASENPVDPRTPFWEDDAAIEFVLDNPRGASLEDVGIALGVSRERIRQIEEGALAKVRAALKLRRIHDSSDLAMNEGTHAGHDHAVRETRGLDSDRRDLSYAAWDAAEVGAFVDAWSPLVRGWIVSLTDHRLFRAWQDALDLAGRVTFQDIPALVRGMTVRLAGDGPSSWAIHCAVARPRTREMARWGTLDGGYVGPSEPQPVVGGKPLWLMRALVRDYTRPGDLVCDPCAGGGTTLLAARLEGRRAIGCDISEAHCEIAARRLERNPREHNGQLALLGGER